MEISWSIEGEQQLSRVLRGIELELQDFRVPLQNIANNLTKVFSEDVFQTQGGAIGVSWKPLSPVTLARKARLGQSSQPLVATGAMQASFGSTVGSHQAVIHNSSDYFKYHQSNRPRRKIPRRVMMKLGQHQKEEIVKEFQLAFIKKMKNV
jgi:phage gpG-like protein